MKSLNRAFQLKQSVFTLIYMFGDEKKTEANSNLSRLCSF